MERTSVQSSAVVMNWGWIDVGYVAASFRMVVEALKPGPYLFAEPRESYCCASAAEVAVNCLSAHMVACY